MAADYGADPADIAKVEAFAAAHKLRVSQVSAARRSIWLNGTVAEMEAAFGVTLQEYSLPGGGTYRGHTGPIMIPADLAGIIVGVFGLDNRPQARPHFRLRRNHQAGNPAIRPAAAMPTPVHSRPGRQALQFPHRCRRDRRSASPSSSWAAVST